MAPIYQAYNPRNKSWVKYKFDVNGFRVLDVKQKESGKKFKNVKVRGNTK